MKKTYTILIISFFIISKIIAQDSFAYKNHIYSYHGNLVYKVDISNLSPDPIILDDRISVFRSNIDVIGAITIKEPYLYIGVRHKIYKVNLDENEPTEIDVITSLDIDVNSLAIYKDELYIGSRNKLSKIDLNLENPILNDVASTSFNSPIKGYPSSNKIVFFNDILYILSSNKIFKIDFGETIPEVTDVFSGLDFPSDLIVHQSNLYVSENYLDEIYKITHNENTTEKINLETGLILNNPRSLVFYEDNLFVLQITTRDYVKFYNANLNTLSLINTPAKKVINIFPNPSSDYITISGLQIPKNYFIYNSIGVKIKSGKISNQKKINIQNLNKGLYFLQIENIISNKFIKI